MKKWYLAWRQKQRDRYMRDVAAEEELERRYQLRVFDWNARINKMTERYHMLLSKDNPTHAEVMQVDAIHKFLKSARAPARSYEHLMIRAKVQ